MILLDKQFFQESSESSQFLQNPIDSCGQLGPTTNANKHKARYYKRKAEQRCVRCNMPWTEGTMCEWCKDKTYRIIRRYQKRKPIRAARAIKSKAYRQSAKGKENLKQYRLDKKLRGECGDCSEPIAEDTIYCAKHLATRRSGTISYYMIHQIVAVLQTEWFEA